MTKTHIVTGFCPVKKAIVSVPIPYIFDGFVWDKGIGACPHAFNCKEDCPVITSAPAELANL